MFTVFLGLLTFCLALFFFSLFFQFSRLEPRLNQWVKRLEIFLMRSYGLIDRQQTSDDKEH